MLRFVVALRFEARPLIARYRLEPERAAGAFEVHRRDDVALVVSGVGKVASAAATAYLHLAAGGARQAAWINAGIAGHGRLAVGEAVLAHTVRDAASGRVWHPPRAFAPLDGASSVEVVTVDAVEEVYAGDAAYEMEASGFYPTACRFATSELVQCLKVVSDGPDASPSALTARRAERLMSDRLDEIESLAAALAPLAEELRRFEEEPPELAELLARWRFSVTQTRQLRRLVERWRALAPGRALPVEELAPSRRGKDVLAAMRRRVDDLALERA